MSYVNARESRGRMAIAADDFDDGGYGGAGTTKPPGLRVEPSQPRNPGGSTPPKVIRTPLPRLQLPVKAGQVSFTPAGPTRATTLFPIPGILPRPTIVRGPALHPGVLVKPLLPGHRPTVNSPPILSRPITPGALIKPKLPEIVMTQPGPAGAIVPVSTPTTGGGPSPSLFPQRPRGELIKPKLPEFDTLDVRELVAPTPATTPGMSTKKKVVIAVAGVAALGLLYYATRRKPTP